MVQVVVELAAFMHPPSAEASKQAPRVDLKPLARLKPALILRQKPARGHPVTAATAAVTATAAVAVTLANDGAACLAKLRSGG
ncbi:MAG TPA: hypothetical protein VE075_00685 [Thermoanaerobaculia bacterium]|nr:hypothetical protein [Thermoanaerobaculia bacterium]